MAFSYIDTSPHFVLVPVAHLAGLLCPLNGSTFCSYDICIVILSCPLPSPIDSVLYFLHPRLHRYIPSVYKLSLHCVSEGKHGTCLPESGSPVSSIFL